jgi:hypothetical protein
MEKYLRDWRQEALNRHQYDTAIFVADKLYALTSMLHVVPPLICADVDGQTTTTMHSG